MGIGSRIDHVHAGQVNALGGGLNLVRIADQGNLSNAALGRERGGVYVALLGTLGKHDMLHRLARFFRNLFHDGHILIPLSVIK